MIVWLASPSVRRKAEFVNRCHGHIQNEFVVRAPSARKPPLLPLYLWRWGMIGKWTRIRGNVGIFNEEINSDTAVHINTLKLYLMSLLPISLLFSVDWTTNGEIPNNWIELNFFFLWIYNYSQFRKIFFFHDISALQLFAENSMRIYCMIQWERHSNSGKNIRKTRNAFSTRWFYAKLYSQRSI